METFKISKKDERVLREAKDSKDIRCRSAMIVICLFRDARQAMTSVQTKQVQHPRFSWFIFRELLH